MSRLGNLLREVEQHDPQLAQDLRDEVRELRSRRSFGLNFERHTPETVELPGRVVRKGDKVRVLASRSQDAVAVEPDRRLWRVQRVEGSDANRQAHLHRAVKGDETQVESILCPVADLIVVAEFRDPIYPGLRSTSRVERSPDKPFHAVINAENYHALQALLYTHEGKVDAIYIDPPYNTGARDWKYNNDYVDADDHYRHSKWLAFMERRLRVAKQLLNPSDSVLIVAIDDKEVHRLALLLQQTFPSARIQVVSTIINPQGNSSGSGEFSRVHEYLIFVALGDAGLTKWSRSMVENDKEANDVSDDVTVRWADFARYGGNASRRHSPGAFFPIFVDVETETIHSVGDAIPWGVSVETVEAPRGTRAVWPPKRPDGTDGRWRTVAESCRELIEHGYIKVGPFNPRSQRHSFAYLQGGTIDKIVSGEIVVVGRDEKNAVVVQYAGQTKTATPKTIWTLPSHDASRHGANMLAQLVPGRRFPYPKSLYAVEDAIRFFVKNNPDALVVDFFAGSGTTAHAVMRLNRQDGGRRRSISVTNNEVSADEQRALRKAGLRPGDDDWEALGICEHITKPRLTAAVTGKTPSGLPIKGEYRFTDEFPMAEGFEENVEFFTMSYEAPRAVAHNRSFAAIAPILWLRAGAEGRRIDLLDAAYDVADNYAVLLDLDYAHEFTDALREHGHIRTAFIITDDERGFQFVCADLPPEVTPVRLYESYLTNFVINVGGE